MLKNKRIIISSLNPVKIQSVITAFEKWFPENEFEFKGISVPSGVANQPMSDEETLQGALNRAKNARDEEPFADFWVGVEGGIEKNQKDLYAFAWMAIVSSESEKVSKTRTANFLLPRTISELVLSGVELGEADDMVFGRENSKQEDGAIGILTDGMINRHDYYAHALILALIPFVKSDLYI